MATISATALAGPLRLAIARSARRLRQEAGSGLSPSLTAALATVERHGPLTPSELAARERIQRPAATRIVTRLEEEGLVACTDDPADGRRRLVAITAAGEALIAASRSQKDAYLERRLARLSPAERTTLAEAAELLERVLAQDDPA